MPNKPSYVLVDGVQMRVCEACQKYGIEKHVFFDRLTNGWSVDRALKTEVRKYRKRQAKDGRRTPSR